MVPTVVIIDDSDDFLSAASGLLNEEGFLVVGCVAHSSRAVDEVRRLRASVVLLDIQLPSTDGFALAAAHPHRTTAGGCVDVEQGGELVWRGTAHCTSAWLHRKERAER